MWSTLWLFVLKSLQVNSAVRAVAEGTVCAGLPERNWKSVHGNSCHPGSGGAPDAGLCFSHKHWLQHSLKSTAVGSKGGSFQLRALLLAHLFLVR